MNIEDLRIFITLAEKLNYTQAAEVLHFSQSTLSRHIMDLEGQLGQNLFNRTTRRVELTEFGRRFLVEARRMLRNYDSMMYQLSNFSGNTPENLVIGTPEFMCGSFLPGLIRQFSEAYPAVILEFQLIEPGNCISLLKNQIIDIGFFASTDDVFGQEGLQFAEVSTGELVLVMSKSHLLAQKKCITLDDLRGERIYVTNRSKTPYLWNTINRYLSKQDSISCRLEEVSSPDIMMMLVEAGLGICPLAENLIGEFRNGNQLIAVPIDGLESRTTLLAAWNQNTENTAIKKFVDMMQLFLQG